MRIHIWENIILIRNHFLTGIICGRSKIQRSVNHKRARSYANILSLAIFSYIAVHCNHAVRETVLSIIRSKDRRGCCFIIICYFHMNSSMLFVSKKMYIYIQTAPGHALCGQSPETMSKCRFIFMSLLPTSF